MNKKSQNIIIVLSVLSIVCLATFLSIFTMLKMNKIFSIDDEVLSAMVNLRNNSLTAFVKVITQIGSVLTLFLISVFVIIFVKDNYLRISIGINYIFALGLSVAIKWIISRPRPLESLRLIKETGYSFPSAHSLVTTAVFLILAFVVIKMLKNKPLKIILTTILVCVPAIIGWTRLYLGVHYFTDVCAGWLLGVFTASISVIIYYVMPQIYSKIRTKKFKGKKSSTH